MYNVDPHGAAVFFLAFAILLPICCVLAVGILDRKQRQHDDV